MLHTNHRQKGLNKPYSQLASALESIVTLLWNFTAACYEAVRIAWWSDLASGLADTACAMLNMNVTFQSVRG